MKTDPLAPRLLIAYVDYCERFGPVDYDRFILQWHAVDAVLSARTSSSSSFTRLLHRAVQATTPHIGKKRPRPENGRPGLENSSGGLENSSRDIN
jgi:hypothetical protein